MTEPPARPDTPPRLSAAEAAVESAVEAVVCDVDGCLCPETADAFDLRALAAVRSYSDAANVRGDRPRITLCTGRPVAFAEALARALGVSLPIMAENGAWIWDPVSNEHELDPAISDSDLAAVAELDAWTRQTLGARGVTIQPGKRAAVTLYHPDAALLGSEILERTRAACAERGWPFRVSMTWFYINCDLAHVSKRTAIERFGARTGLSGPRLAGVGDTTSDAAIADAVAWFACPANAQDAIKTRAHFVAGASEAEGTLEILERLRAARG